MKAFPTVFMDYIPKPEHQGMDLRDYFAAKAMAGILTMLRGGNEGLITVQESVSKYAYEWADEMMKARNR